MNISAQGGRGWSSERDDDGDNDEEQDCVCVAYYNELNLHICSYAQNDAFVAKKD